MNQCIKCGKIPKVRYILPVTWVECKCGRRSKYVSDIYEQNDPESRASAIEDWNRKNVEATE